MKWMRNVFVGLGLVVAAYGCGKKETEATAPAPAAEQKAAAAGTEETAKAAEELAKLAQGTVDPKPEAKAEPAKEEAKKEPEAAAAGDSVGIPACDEYITKYEKCLNDKVPEASRGPMKDAFAQTRASWKTMAADPLTKASLADACKQATDAAKASMSAFGCDF
jgi:hypothetical protein